MQAVNVHQKKQKQYWHNREQEDMSEVPVNRFCSYDTSQQKLVPILARIHPFCVILILSGPLLSLSQRGIENKNIQ